MSSDWTDAELARLIAATIDEPPAILFGAAESIFEFAMAGSGVTDAELAELLSVEAADAGVRGGEDVERREYRCGTHTLVLVVDFKDRTVGGQILPPTEAVVELVDREGSTVDSSVAPSTGYFLLRAEPGPHTIVIGLRTDQAAAARFRLDWLPI